jgi:hypothetical protein
MRGTDASSHDIGGRTITDRAIDYMQRMASGSKPFFLFVP